ncbi:Spo0E family sporulation regulatory protein-aspartic acid phosphatase [Bacillus sp. AK128]
MLELLIEEKRAEMIGLAMKLGFTANETVKCSQELDKLIDIKLTSYRYLAISGFSLSQASIHHLQ